MSTTRVCNECGTEYGVEQRFCPRDGSPLRLRNANDQLVGRVIADRYHVLELLGVGGMGRVYVAEHVALGRKSAVKVISPAFATAPDAISRFNREAANASRINHPNIAQIYDFGESEGLLYLAMEFVEGEALATILERQGPLPVSRAANITMQAADALSAAHLLGIVHRDLKPENIMIGRKHDGADWVKVVDFGIAKTVEREQHGSQTVTTAGVSLGTPEYMSPEQFAGEKLDHKTDIYSLGLVLFNMLTGELPYPKVTSKETLVKRLTSQPRPLAEVRPDTIWPAGLQTALDRALAPDAADRYSRAVDFGTDVTRASERAPEMLRRGAATVAVPHTRTEPRPVSGARMLTPTVRTEVSEEAPRRRLWPYTLVALVLGLGGFAATHPAEVQRAAGFMRAARLGATDLYENARGRTREPADSTGMVAPVAVSESLPSLSVIPQGGERGASVNPATLPPTDSQALIRAARTVARAARAAATPPPVTPEISQPAIVLKPIVPESTAAPAPKPAAPRAAETKPSDSKPADSAAMRPLSALRHPWLRANGDSGTARIIEPGTGEEELVKAQMEELQGHLAVGMRYATKGDVARAKVAFRDATEEARGLKLADHTIAGQVDLLMRNAQRDAWQACQAARADTSNAGAASTDCGTLFAW